jgi:large subunit ribosomal protein L6
MSRIGKQPITIPAKVDVKINGNEVTVKGPRGELNDSFNPELTIKLEDGQVMVERPTDQRHHRALHGLTRALLQNMVTGVSDGFRKELQIEGVGYQAGMQGNNLELKVGLSHPVVIEPPENVPRGGFRTGAPSAATGRRNRGHWPA